MEPETKICNICGLRYDESNDINDYFKNGPTKCPHCKEIIELRDLITQFNYKFKDKVWASKVHERNFVPSNYNLGFPDVTVSKLNAHNIKYKSKDRSKRVKKLIKDIKHVRSILFFDFYPRFEILESIVVKKDIFWEDSGSLVNYISEDILRCIVITFNELINSDSPYSISQINSLIYKNRKNIFCGQKIYEVTKFDKTNDVMRIKVPKFPLEEFSKKVKNIRKRYSKLFKTFNFLRNHKYAHLDKTYIDIKKNGFTFYDLKRIYNSLRIIYDGYLILVAYDEYRNMSELDCGLGINRLNLLSKFYRKHRKDFIS